MAYRQKKKVRVLNENFLLLIRQILAKSPLGQALGAKEGEIILLVVNYNNVEIKLNSYFNEFSSEEKLNFHFLVGIPPVVGGEERLARLIDFLHTQSQEITNLSKNKNFNFGTSLADWKLLLQLLQPNAIILLHNSYKNARHLPYLTGNLFQLSNQHFYQFSTEKISRLKVKKTLTTLEEILIKQKKNLWAEGLLVIFLLVG